MVLDDLAHVLWRHPSLDATAKAEWAGRRRRRRRRRLFRAIPAGVAPLLRGLGGAGALGAIRLRTRCRRHRVQMGRQALLHRQGCHLPARAAPINILQPPADGGY